MIETQRKPVYAKNWQELAVHLMRVSKAQYDAYDAAVRDWYEHGDGRSTARGGKGHTYPECRHGYSRWTDYDNICGACEDGFGYFDYLRELGIAKEMAKDAFQDMNDRIALYVDLHNKIRNSGMPVALDNKEFTEWAMKPVRIK